MGGSSQAPCCCPQHCPAPAAGGLVGAAPRGWGCCWVNRAVGSHPRSPPFVLSLCLGEVGAGEHPAALRPSNSEQESSGNLLQEPVKSQRK